MAAPVRCQKGVLRGVIRFEAAARALTHVAVHCPVVPQEPAAFPEEPPDGGYPQEPAAFPEARPDGGYPQEERGDCLDLACFPPEPDGYPGPMAVGHGTQEYYLAARFHSAH
jgi:hypothetical protein